jgi:hypothetical protein
VIDSGRLTLTGPFDSIAASHGLSGSQRTGCLGLIVLSLMILACGLRLYEDVTLRDDLVSHGLSSAVPIPVAANRSTATATRDEPEYSHFLIAGLLANGYDD